jgi:polysaccharide export outer membrane protein
MRRTFLLFTIFACVCASALISRGQETQSPKPEAPRECFVVLGAVVAPGRFESKRRIRLSEAIAFAGGFTEHAGDTIQITSSGAKCPMETRDVQKTAAAPTHTISQYQRACVSSNNEELNPYLSAGDIVVVNEVETVFVVGAVVQPRQVLPKNGMTLTQAIDAAGGPVRGALTDRVRIIRQTSNSSERVQIMVDLNKLRKKNSADPVLQPNDIIEVHPKHGMTGDFGPVPPIYDAPLPVRVIYDIM